MSVISLSESTRLGAVPELQLTDPRFENLAGRTRELERATNAVLGDANMVYNDINRDKETANNRLEHCKTVQDAWQRFVTITGGAIVALLSLELAKGGWRMWKWSRERREQAIKEASETEFLEDESSSGVSSSKKRLHPREWKVSQI